jgi:hypothetical protein
MGRVNIVLGGKIIGKGEMKPLTSDYHSLLKTDYVGYFEYLWSAKAQGQLCTKHSLKN